MIPGSNLLARASRLIGLTNVAWSEYTGTTTGGDGVIVPTYAAPVTIAGSLQPVTRAMYEAMGLDFTRDYLMFYTIQLLKDLQRDRTPDRIDFNGQRYAVESNTAWHIMDGWIGSLLVRTGPTP